MGNPEVSTAHIECLGQVTLEAPDVLQDARAIVPCSFKFNGSFDHFLNKVDLDTEEALVAHHIDTQVGELSGHRNYAMHLLSGEDIKLYVTDGLIGIQK